MAPPRRYRGAAASRLGVMGRLVGGLGHDVVVSMLTKEIAEERAYLGSLPSSARKGNVLKAKISPWRYYWRNRGTSYIGTVHHVGCTNSSQCNNYTGFSNYFALHSCVA